MRSPLFFLLLCLPCVVVAQESQPTTSQPSTAPATQSTPPPLVAGVCGDAVLNLKEECDDGNIAVGDGCSNACRVERCGDRSVQGGRGENCDDGNDLNGDGCSSSCLLEESSRSPIVGGLISVAASSVGFFVANAILRGYPVLISLTVGPTLGRLYMRDTKNAVKLTLIRGGGFAAFGLGFLIASSVIRAENIGNGVVGDFFPGDGTFLLGGTVLFLGAGVVAGGAFFDIATIGNRDVSFFRFGGIAPTPIYTPQGTPTLGLSLRATF